MPSIMARWSLRVSLLTSCFKRLSEPKGSILPLRRERAKKQIKLFQRLLATEGAEDYHDLVRKTFSKHEFTDLHNDILELYAEETFIINSSLTSVIDVDSEGIAHRMHCSMIDMGFKMNMELAETIFE